MVDPEGLGHEGRGERTGAKRPSDPSHRKVNTLPDNILLIVFGTLAAIGLIFGTTCLVFAVKNAKRRDDELRMAFWAVGALAGFVLAGASIAYFIIPIVLFRLSSP